MNMISGLFQKSDIDNLDLIFINAIAFDKTWDNPYKDRDIKKEQIFNNRNGSKTKTTLLYSEENQYIENSYFTGFLKAYKGKDYYFMGLLPKDDDTSVLETLLGIMDFRDLFASAIKRDVEVYIPEFEYENDVDLKRFCEHPNPIRYQ